MCFENNLWNEVENISNIILCHMMQVYVTFDLLIICLGKKI